MTTRPLPVRGIFNRAVRDRWVGHLVAVASLGIWLLLAMAVYRDIDLSLYTDLPEGVRSLMGIPDGADVAGLAYNIVLGLAAPLTLAGLAISAGSSSIAGEERDGTAGLLLANPVSRRHVLSSKLTAMVTMCAAAAAGIWAVALAVPAVLGVETSGLHLGAMCTHLAVNAVFWGLVAAAVGGWTGRSSLASGIATGAMLLSYVAAGLLPLVDSIAGAVKLDPWYYFDGAEPLLRGLSGSHVAVLSLSGGLLAAASLVGVGRRDLRGPAEGGSLLGRLRSHRATERIFERLAGSTRVSRPWVKIASEHQGVLLVTALAMFTVMGVLLGPMYDAIDEDLAAFAADVPEQILALAGGGDLSTPRGWYQAETFSLMAPMAVMIVAVVTGARALGREEALRTMGMLLANPLRRTSVVLAHAVAMTVAALVVGVATATGVMAGVAVADLDIPPTSVLAASVHTTLLGLVFGAFALAVAAVVGGGRLATFAAIGAALTSHLLDSFLPLSTRWSGWARLTPSHYALGGDPLTNGIQWTDAAVLTVLVAALVTVAAMGFVRRDVA